MAEYKMESLKTFNYDRPVIEKGYTNQTLCIDISDGVISIKPVTEKMKNVFIGGKGLISGFYGMLSTAQQME